MEMIGLSMIPILFFQASRKIGGAENMFIRLGKSLITRGHHLIVVDYEDGTVVKELMKLNSLNIKFINYKPGEKHKIDTECVALLPFGAIHFLSNEIILNPLSKVIFLSVHHHHILELGNIGFILKKLTPDHVPRIWRYLEFFRYRQVRNLIKILNAKCGLIYIAEFQRVLDFKFLGEVNNQPIIPIPISVDDLILPISTRLKDNAKGIVWVSRLEGEKIVILKSLLKNICLAGFAGKVYIVGDGDDLVELKSFTKTLPIECVFSGVIKGRELQKFIQEKGMLCIGVGTASLEMALSGIPTLVSEIQPVIGKDAKSYQWVHDLAKGDSVAMNNGENNISISDALSAILDDDGYVKIGLLGREYVVVNHHVDRVLEMIEFAISETKVCYRELDVELSKASSLYCFIRLLKLKILS